MFSIIFFVLQIITLIILAVSTDLIWLVISLQCSILGTLSRLEK